MISKIPHVKYVYLDGFELTQDANVPSTFGVVDNNGAQAAAIYRLKTSSSPCDADHMKGYKVYSECNVKINTPAQSVINQYKDIIQALHQQPQLTQVKVLIMSSFMPLDSTCNFLKVSEPSNDAKQLVNLAEQVGADGVAVDYEPVAVNQIYNENYKLYAPSSSLKALDYNTFAKLYFDNQNKNTSPYFEALRNDVIGSQKLNQGKGLCDCRG